MELCIILLLYTALIFTATLLLYRGSARYVSMRRYHMLLLIDYFTNSIKDLSY